MIFTADKDIELSKDLIEKAIDWNEQHRADYDKLENYYRGEHDIKHRVKPLTAKNSRVVINHAKYITDSNVGYMLGKPIDYSPNNDAYDLEPVKEEYREQSMNKFDRELAKQNSIFGRQYELVYADDNDVRSALLDVRNCVIIYDDTVQHKEMYAVVYERESYKTGVQYDKNKSKYSYNSLVVYDSFGWKDCLSGKNMIVVPEEYTQEHSFGAIPVVEYKNNSECLGDFEIVLDLIDVYNLLCSDRINDKEQLVDALLVVKGIGELTPKQKDQLRSQRMITIGDKDVTLEYLLKNLDESQIDILRQTIKEDIHKISMTPDFTDEKFVGNSSGVAIRYKLLNLEWNVSNKIMDMQEGLAKRFNLYNNYLISLTKSSEIPSHEVDIVFTRNLPQNDYETSQMINNLSHLLPASTLVEQLSFIENAQAEIESKEKEDTDKYAKEYGSMEPSVEEEEEKGLMQRLVDSITRNE